MAITSAMASSFKQELLQGAHCFNAQISTITGNSHTNNTLDGLSSTVGVAVGMNISGGDIATNATVVGFNSTTSITIYPGTINTHSGLTYVVLGDLFMIALIKTGMAGTYGAANTNYSNITGNSDEVVGAGYSGGGLQLGNVTPALSGTTAYTTFAPNPSWSGASFSTAGCMIYNFSSRLAGIVGRCCGVFDFGGTQTVTAGVFTVLMPVAASATAILRVG